MSKRDKLEPLADGWVAFHTESGDRWKHKDFTESGAPGGPFRWIPFRESPSMSGFQRIITKELP